MRGRVTTKALATALKSRLENSVPKTGESNRERRDRSSSSSKRPTYYPNQRLLDKKNRQGLEDAIERTAKQHAKAERGPWPAPVERFIQSDTSVSAQARRGSKHNKLYPPGAPTDQTPDEDRKDSEDYANHVKSAQGLRLKPMSYADFRKARKEK